MEKSLSDKIWTHALRLLSLRMMSRFELKQKLLKKFSDSNSLIEVALDKLESLQLMNDAKYAEQLINYLIQKPIGRLKISIEFKKRGLDTDLASQLLQNSNYNEQEQAMVALSIKAANLKEKDPYKYKQKLMHFLKNKGFTTSAIYSAINRK